MWKLRYVHENAALALGQLALCGGGLCGGIYIYIYIYVCMYVCMFVCIY